jgi:signal transduction histidine kinase
MEAASVEALRILYQQMRGPALISLIGGMTMAVPALFFWPVWLCAGWLAVHMAIQLIRAWIATAVLREGITPANAIRRRQVALALEIPVALWWGLSAVIFIDFEQPMSVVFVVCSLTGISAHASTWLAYHPWSCALGVSIMGLMAAASLIVQGGAEGALLALFGLMFCAALTVSCFTQARFVLEGIRIRFENEEVLEALRIQTAVAEAARRDAERANLAKSQFLAAASHDLRQPLYALSLFSASLGGSHLDEHTRRIVRDIQDSVGVMESLFVGLLDISKLEAGVIKATPGAVSVDALFDRLNQYFRPAALERGLDLRFRSDNEWLTSDPILLEQLLGNLLSNALRCTDRGGVLVAARRRGGATRLEVWDTGVGIEQPDFDRIFDEFVQLANPERDRRKGLGLGLSIARRSASLIGGTIEVASRPGRGSRFAISQPALPPSTGTSATVAPRIEAVRWDAALPLLIVEDDRDVRNALGLLLRTWGLRFEALADAASALAAIEAGNRYGLILSDYRLGGSMNGLDLITQIKELRSTPAPSTVLITGDVDPSLISAAHALGVSLLLKPLNPKDLRTLLGLSAIP